MIRLNHVSLFSPSAIDNSYSTIQIIHKLENELNSMIDKINEIEDVSTERANAYTDSKIAEVNADIIEIRNAVNELDNDNELIHSMINEINVTLDNIDNSLNTLNQLIITTGQACNDYTDLKIDILNIKLSNDIDRLYSMIIDVTNIDVYSGHNGLKTSLQDYIINDGMHQSYTDNRYSMTWDEFENTTDGWNLDYPYQCKMGNLIFVPNWYNLEYIQRVTITDTIRNYMYVPILTTFDEFFNTPLLYIVSMCAFIFTGHTTYLTGLTMYVFDYQQWSLNKSLVPPTEMDILLVDINSRINESLQWYQVFKSSCLDYLKSRALSTASIIGSGSQNFFDTSNASNLQALMCLAYGGNLILKNQFAKREV